MSTSLPIIRSNRRIDLDCAAGQTVFTFDKPLFDVADLAVKMRIAPATSFFTVPTGFTVALLAGGATVTFAAAPRTSAGDPVTTVRLSGARIQARTTDVTRGGAVRSVALETELDLQSMVLQELRRDVDEASGSSYADAASAAATNASTAAAAAAASASAAAVSASAAATPWTPDLTATGVTGNPGLILPSTLLKGEIWLEYTYPGLTFGVGVTSQQRIDNTAILNCALVDSGQKRRPLRGKAGAVLEINNIALTQNNVEFDLNGMTLRHGPTIHTTMFYVYGASAASRILNFKMYNGILDGNAQAKIAGSGYYIFSAVFHSGMVLENLDFLDPWGTAWIISDPYPVVGGYPAMTSDNLRMKRIRTVRSAANITKIATNPSMMQADQAVVTGVYQARLEGISAYYSGRSGLSFGLNDGGVVKDFSSSLCWCPLYLEALSNSRITGFDIRDYMPFDGNAAAAVDAHGIWLVDGDQSVPGLGLPTGKNVVIDDGIITSFSVTGAAQKSFHGVHVTGRDGANHGIGVRISNITMLGLARSGGTGSAVGLSLGGQLTGVQASNIIARQCDAGYAADVSYTAPGGTAANAQTDVWVDGLLASGCTYAAYATGGGGTFTRSGIRNSTFGGSTVSLAAGIGNINNT